MSVGLLVEAISIGDTTGWKAIFNSAQLFDSQIGGP